MDGGCRSSALPLSPCARHGWRAAAPRQILSSGAYCLTLPTAWRDHLGPFLQVEAVDLELTDQRAARGELCNPVRIEVPGLGADYGEVLFIEMEGRDGAYEPLLGYLSLEQLRVTVDLASRRLVKMPRVDLESAAA